MEQVAIKTEFIKLDQLLKFANVADSGGFAKMIIKDGMVSLNGEKELQRGKKIYPGDQIEVCYENEEGQEVSVSFKVVSE